MNTVDIPNLVVGNPPSVFDSSYFAQQPPHETEALKAASERGNLQQIRELSRNDKVSPDDLVSAHSLAQQNGHLDVASHLLKFSVPIQPFHVEHSITSKDYLFLSLFLEHSYNINTPINWTTPPLLM